MSCWIEPCLNANTVRFCKDRKIKYDDCADGVGRLAALTGTPEFRAARTTIVR